MHLYLYTNILLIPESQPLFRTQERLDTIVKKLDEALSLKQTYGPLRPKEPFAMEALREADHGGRIW
jgi:hypothetical protein